VAFDDLAVGGTDLVRQHDHEIADPDVGRLDLLERRADPPVRTCGHAAGQRAQHRGGLRDRMALERGAARQHQHDDGAGEIFVERGRGDNRHGRQEVRSEAAAQRARGEANDEGHAADGEDQQQRRVCPRAVGCEP
jgi:hypothetical protein